MALRAVNFYPLSLLRAPTRAYRHNRLHNNKRVYIECHYYTTTATTTTSTAAAAAAAAATTSTSTTSTTAATTTRPTTFVFNEPPFPQLLGLMSPKENVCFICRPDDPLE